MSGPTASVPALDDVLDAFAMERSPDRTTLERYLRRYPQFADALIDLSRELHRALPSDVESRGAEDEAIMDAAWRRYLEAGAQTQTGPFAALSADEQRALAKTLDVPRQVITAFHDGKVIWASVPSRFLARLAEALGRSVDSLQPTPAAPPGLAAARSHKADVKPSASEPVTFERILMDAGVPDEKRARLLSDSD
jgi:hypothetical protein